MAAWPVALFLLTPGLVAPVAALKSGRLQNSTRNSSGSLAAGGSLGAQVQALLTKIETNATVAGAKAAVQDTGGLKKPEPALATSTYSLRTCDDLFEYKRDRARCYKLQEHICPGACSRFFLFRPGFDPAGAQQCEHLRTLLCAAPIPVPTSRPAVVEHGSLATTTFCNAFPPTHAGKGDDDRDHIFIQHNKYQFHPDPEPFVWNLRYTECKQVAIPAGQKLNIFLGRVLPEWVKDPNEHVAAYVAGTENAVVMLGQHNLGSKEMGIGLFTFENEPDHYRRPIICSAYPEPYITVEVAGRNWHPFTDADHPSALEYMTCKRLALDHAGSVRSPETLDFFEGTVHTGELEITPTEMLFVIGNADFVADGARLASDFHHSSYAFGNLETRRKPKKVMKGPYDKMWTDPASRKITGTPA